jgi:hypothetical protein
MFHGKGKLTTLGEVIEGNWFYNLANGEAKYYDLKGKLIKIENYKYGEVVETKEIK